MTPAEHKMAIHYFDSKGKGMLTRDFEEQEIIRLKAENERLRSLLRKTVTALKSSRNNSMDSNIQH